MTHLTKDNDSDANSWREFKKQNDISQMGKIEISFQDGHCILLDSTNQDVLDWGESRGLT